MCNVYDEPCAYCKKDTHCSERTVLSMLCCTFESIVFAQSIQIVDNGWCDEGVGEQGEGEGEQTQKLKMTGPPWRIVPSLSRYNKI